MKTVMDKNSGAILFKKDNRERKVDFLEKRIDALEKRLKKLEKSSKSNNDKES